MIQQADTNNTEYTSNPKDITILGNEVTSLLDSFGDLNPFHRFEEMRVFFKKPIAVSPGSLSTSLSLEETIRSIKEKYPRLNLEKLTLAKAEVHFKGPIVLTTQENQAIPHNQIKLQSKIKKNKNTLTSKPLINIQKFDRYETAFGPETTIQMTTKKEQFNHTLESHFINPYTGVQLSKFQRYKNAIQTIYGSAIFAELPHLQAFCANASAASFFDYLSNPYKAGKFKREFREIKDNLEIISKENIWIPLIRSPGYVSQKTNFNQEANLLEIYRKNPENNIITDIIDMQKPDGKNYEMKIRIAIQEKEKYNPTEIAQISAQVSLFPNSIIFPQLRKEIKEIKKDIKEQKKDFNQRNIYT